MDKDKLKSRWEDMSTKQKDLRNELKTLHMSLRHVRTIMSDFRKEQRKESIKIEDCLKSIDDYKLKIVLTSEKILQGKEVLACQDFLSLLYGTQDKRVISEHEKSELRTSVINSCELRDKLTNKLKEEKEAFAKAEVRLEETVSNYKRSSKHLHDTEQRIREIKGTIVDINRSIDTEIFKRETLIDFKSDVNSSQSLSWLTLRVCVIDRVTLEASYNVHLYLRKETPLMGKVTWFRLREGFATSSRDKHIKDNQRCIRLESIYNNSANGVINDKPRTS